jgi:glutaredoxin
MKKQTIFIIMAILVVAVFFSYKVIGSLNAPGQYDDFAKCLTEKNIKMYGTEWCPHCKAQKKLFGKSFDFVDYIDCDWNKDTCLLEGIAGYPTWKINGNSYPGTQQLSRLSQLSGCEL